MTQSVIARNPDPTTIEKASKGWSYSTSFLLYAMAQTQDRQAQQYSKRWVDRFMKKNGRLTESYRDYEFQLDHLAPGRLLLELYERTGDLRYLIAAQILIDQLENHPRTTDGGFWHKKVYTHQMWLDGIYMGCPMMSEFARITGHSRWHDEAARQILTIAEHTRDSKSGLFYHGWDESRSMYWANPQTGQSPNFWGRAMGWYALGIIDTLDYLPVNHPQRDAVIGVLEELAAGIEKTRDPQSGLWYQVLDQPGREGNYLESSASCMFVYALAKGARLGYLDARYGELARESYQSILKQFIVTDAKTGQITLTQTCAVAGLGGRAKRDGSFEYYIKEPRVNNDTKGMASFILASREMEGRGKISQVSPQMPRTTPAGVQE